MAGVEQAPRLGKFPQHCDPLITWLRFALIQRAGNQNDELEFDLSHSRRDWSVCCDSLAGLSCCSGKEQH